MTSLYRATVSTPTGQIEIIVKSAQIDASRDIREAAWAATNFGPAMTRIRGEIVKTNRTRLHGAQEIKRCSSRGETWGWIN